MNNKYACLYLPHTSIYYYLADFNLTWFLKQYHRFSVVGFLCFLSFGIPDEPPCYVRQYAT